MEYKLVLPTSKYSKKIEEFKKTMLENSSGMDGSGALKKDSISLWLKESRDYRLGRNLPDGYVPATQYIYVRKNDNKIVGMLQIRHKLNDFLLNYGGNIGYCVAADERNKNIGTQMLKDGLQKCKKLGMSKVLISCKDTNIASKKVIMANGGKFEDVRILYSDDHLESVKLERYWIDLE